MSGLLGVEGLVWLPLVLDILFSGLSAQVTEELVSGTIGFG